MSKKVVWLIILLVITSLVAILFSQVHLMNNAIEAKRMFFNDKVKISLAKAVQEIKKREENEAFNKYSVFLKDNLFRTKTEISNYIFQQTDSQGKEKFTYGTFKDEHYKIPTGFQFPDSTFVRKITSKKNMLSVKVIDNGKDFDKTIEEDRSTVYKSYTDYDKNRFVEIFEQQKLLLPIDKRITTKQLQKILAAAFEKNNIVLNFNFGVYDKNLATPIKSGYFKKDIFTDHSYPLFNGSDGNVRYRLYVKFPEEDKNLLTKSYKLVGVSVIFSIVIILIFSFSIYQLNNQKKISQIKTDFINNMTHEFKTPIATINLALDAIKNPKVINESDKVLRYVKMIKDENKRMHAQVESVLQISKLEKKVIAIEKEVIDMEEVIEDAIDHISLLADSKKGTIDTHFKSNLTEILGNEHHMINVVVNMLENAIKYSQDKPKIDIFTENTSKFFILKIKDEGIGMSKQAQKNAFHKFYREELGNIHNVKGHGLGLAYVKKIVDHHQGVIFVDSEKGKGSTFTMKLPLI